ncbi:MAG TPA: peptidyl-prolyl cis-trans isomerase [Candidatus Spyradenecus faecavium]|uniref:Peptidyl-prolyl cis-trans isomerase n=1 Tax=Candidatus Spyradenecus faecavium TaxID=2840947 RepID=A0A9D1T342_9BACT|nr:peptidyl-prolyl cis-trans isomerase [Candidatus Spyradenecus faecavium]
MTTVIMKTNKGDITLELDESAAPITVANFLRYVDEGFYDGLIFHRVIPGFMIQGGGFTPDMAQKPTHEPIRNEAHNGLKNRKYTIAMARTPEINSATAQFFINTVDNDFLDFRAPNPSAYGYAVFGRVTAGFDTVDEIEQAPTGTHGRHQDVPHTPIVIESVRRA